jgi:hypothetical protein
MRNEEFTTYEKKVYVCHKIKIGKLPLTNNNAYVFFNFVFMYAIKIYKTVISRNYHLRKSKIVYRICFF